MTKTIEDTIHEFRKDIQTDIYEHFRRCIHANLFSDLSDLDHYLKTEIQKLKETE